MPSITQKQRQLSLATPLGADMLGLRVVSVRDQMKPSRSASIGLPEAGVRSSLERLWLLATGLNLLSTMRTALSRKAYKIQRSPASCPAGRFQAAVF